MREVECGCIDQPINISNRLMLDAINVLCSELPEGIMLNLEQWYYVSFDAINLLCEDSCVILRHLEQTEWIAWSRNSPPWGAHYAFSEPSWHGLLKIFKICLSIWFDGHLVLNRDFLVETVPNTPDHWESITWTLVQNPPSRNMKLNHNLSISNLVTFVNLLCRRVLV